MPPSFHVMETKNIPGVQVKDEDQGLVTARFATLGVVDNDGDLIEPGAFGAQRVKVSAYNHGSWEGALPVGIGTTRESGNAAVADLKFFMETNHGRDHFEVVKGVGDLMEWSFGFDVKRSRPPNSDERRKGVKRVLQGLQVFEVSPVLRGSGVGTRTLSAKCDACAAKAGQGTGPSRADTEAEAAKRLAALLPADPRAFLLAQFSTTVAWKILGFPGDAASPPGVKFFEPDGKGPGMVIPGDYAVYLNPGLTDLQVAEVCAHEMKHMEQIDRGLRSNTPEAEAEALRFGKGWRDAILAAYRASEGEWWKVFHRKGRPPFSRDDEDRVILSRYKCYQFNLWAKGDAWQRRT